MTQVWQVSGERSSRRAEEEGVCATRSRPQERSAVLHLNNKHDRSNQPPLGIRLTRELRQKLPCQLFVASRKFLYYT